MSVSRAQQSVNGTFMEENNDVFYENRAAINPKMRLNSLPELGGGPNKSHTTAPRVQALSDSSNNIGRKKGLQGSNSQDKLFKKPTRNLQLVKKSSNVKKGVASSNSERMSLREQNEWDQLTAGLKGCALLPEPEIFREISADDEETYTGSPGFRNLRLENDGGLINPVLNNGEGDVGDGNFEINSIEDEGDDDDTLWPEIEVFPSGYTNSFILDNYTDWSPKRDFTFIRDEPEFPEPPSPPALTWSTGMFSEFSRRSVSPALCDDIEDFGCPPKLCDSDEEFDLVNATPPPTR